MDDDDFRALIELVCTQLRDVGVEDIADDRHYLVEGRPDAPRMLDPQQHLIQLLKAFERKMSVEDQATYYLALEQLNRSLDGDGPRGAVVELTMEQGRDPIVVSLSDAPDLADVRFQTRELIGQLAESGGTPETL